MSVDLIYDLANSSADPAYEVYGKFEFKASISPKRLKVSEYVVKSLDWKSIPYGEEHKNEVPDDKRGIYAFVICHPSKVLPQHGYVLYMGIAGKNSNRSLRRRYQDYLSIGSLRKRPPIDDMVRRWRDALWFFFAPVGCEISSDDLQKLEIQLNTALTPTYVQRDLDATVGRGKRLWQLR